jgi:hypothetical protein
MIRYVAIGAVLGFLLSVFLLSRSQPPPTAPPEQPAAVFQAPVGNRARGELRIPPGLQRHIPAVVERQVQTAAADGGP